MIDFKTGGCFFFLSYLLYFGAWIGAGILSWNWIEPDSFGRAILFLIIWGILGSIGKIIGSLIVVAMARK
ncbi:MAG TPA: hypothetical protein VKX31_06465 [Brumimicrobium sp.]|nr:hypothetical protein [Brumimicrobium sp.]